MARAVFGGAARIAANPVVWLPLVFLTTAGVGLAWGSWQNLCTTCPSIAQIRTWEPEQTTKLFAHDGRLLVELGIERRTPVSIQSLPSHVPQAVVAIEDKRFYRHGGFDPRGILRAVYGVVTFNRQGGGSTITQQLARNMFTQEIGFERRLSVDFFLATLTRKLREVQVALQLEESYDKDQILEAYLNQIYMGRGNIHGFESAARTYLGKSLAEVNVAEAALLAAILNLPGAYDPFRHPDNALRRRNLVLSRMAEQGYLAEDEAARWMEHPLPTSEHADGGGDGVAPYFEEWVRQILDDLLGAETYRGGFRVYTTLDLDIQRAAREAMEWGWQRIESDPNYAHPKLAQFDTVATFPRSETPYVQGALIALDPQTGHVRAMVGGRDYEQSKFDRVRLAERQAGSAFKPFVYTAALRSGIPASHILMDTVFRYVEVDSTVWEPRNFDGDFEGPMSAREALRRSVNIPAVRMGWEEVGIESVIQTARRMGIRTPINPFPSTTIGAAAVKPIELAEAYSVFASLGARVTPFPIVRVENSRGEVIWEPQPQKTQVLDSAVARIMVDMLEDAANTGSGFNHRVIGELPYEVPTAGKTGTTNDAADVWFTGFTPNLLAVVWLGMDLPQPILRGAGATGGNHAAPVWGRFMRRVYYGEDGSGGEGAGALPIPERWPFPVTVTTREIDRATGKLWVSGCGDPATKRYTEYFVAGTEPTEYCSDPRSNPFRRRPPPG